MLSGSGTEPAMSSRAALVELFSHSLTSFQTSKDAFRIVCTLPGRGTTGHGDTSPPVPRRPQKQRPVKSLVVLDSSFNPPTLAHLRMAASAVRDLQQGQAAAAKTATEAEARAGSVRLLLLLAVNNADKKPKPAAFPVRLGMMHAFAADLLDELGRGPAPGNGGGGLDADEGGIDVDLGLTTMPYFHDKSQAITDTDFYSEGDGKGPEQVYLAGYDTLIRIFNPKYYNAAAPSPSADNAGEGDVEAPIRRALDPFLGRSRLRITMRTDDDWGGEGEQVAYLQRLRDDGLEEVGGRKEWGDRVELVSGRREGEEVISSTKVREAAKRGDSEKLGGLLSARVRDWVVAEGLYRDE
ncbi:hypothetical protein EsH8_II_000624 [Colletotrichum jinshuiense]